MDFKIWLKCALVRACKTFCQSLLSLLTVGNMITDMDWLTMLSISATAFVASILTSVAGLPEVPTEE